MKKKIYLFLVCCLPFCISTASIHGNDSITRVELTDEILPRIDPRISTQFYRMLQDIDRLLNKRGIVYWLTAGSLLGAVRHQGMIPWDDDIDIAFFENDIENLLALRPDLEKLGYEIFVQPDYLKIFLTNGHRISKEDEGYYPWKYPFIDFFPMKQYDEKVSHASERLYKHFANQDWFFFTDVSSRLSYTRFGSLIVPIPNNASDYLERMYGQDVWEVAYADYDHSKEKRLSKIKVKLVTKKCAPDLSSRD